MEDTYVKINLIKNEQYSEVDALKKPRSVYWNLRSKALSLNEIQPDSKRIENICSMAICKLGFIQTPKLLPTNSNILINIQILQGRKMI